MLSIRPHHSHKATSSQKHVHCARFVPPSSPPCVNVQAHCTSAHAVRSKRYNTSAVRHPTRYLALMCRYTVHLNMQYMTSKDTMILLCATQLGPQRYCACTLDIRTLSAPQILCQIVLHSNFMRGQSCKRRASQATTSRLKCQMNMHCKPNQECNSRMRGHISHDSLLFLHFR